MNQVEIHSVQGAEVLPHSYLITTRRKTYLYSGGSEGHSLSAITHQHK